jgi:hypothetical protein
LPVSLGYQFLTAFLFSLTLPVSLGYQFWTALSVNINITNVID